LETTGGT